MPEINHCDLCPKSVATKIVITKIHKGKELKVCQHHENHLDDKSAIVEELREIVKDVQKKGIKKISKAQGKKNYQYGKKRKEYLAEHPMCEIRVEGCTGKATEIHHTKGRVGKNMTDETTFKSTCPNCHRWTEVNPKQAKEIGASQSRLKTKNQAI